MSYPFTKPVPRYGFRRNWNDPHTGIVGSGPGRPMRRYPTDPEVGLPQLGPGMTALGATQETPFNEGIFTLGPRRGFSRGVFTPDPPWASPRYIASTPDGVSGLGAFGATPKCGIDELVNKVLAAFPKLSFSMPFVGSFSIASVPELIKPAIYSLVGTAGEKLASMADKSAGDIAGWLASNVSTPIAQKIMQSGSVPDVVKSAGSSIITKLVDDTLRSQLYKVGEIIRECAGVEAPSVPAEDVGQWICRKDATGATKCYRADEDPLAQFKMVYTQQIQSQPQLVTMSDRALQELAVKSVASTEALKKQCCDSGGEWYYGGAMCDVNPTTKALQNCRAPDPPTYSGKKYNCVPKGTPGALPCVAAASASSAFPLILGVAAVAAFVLTRS